MFLPTIFVFLLVVGSSIGYDKYTDLSTTDPAWSDLFRKFYEQGLLSVTPAEIHFVRVIKYHSYVFLRGAIDSLIFTIQVNGFGLATACHLSERGFRVFAGCLNVDSAGAVTLKNKHNDNLYVLPLDITKDESVSKALQYVHSNLGETCLWGLVNNAGVCTYGDLELESLDAYKRVYEVNVFGTLRLTKTFLPLIRKVRGRIVILSSVAGILNYPGYSCYGSSKAALESISDCLRMEMSKFGVKVCVLEPSSFVGATNVLSDENVERIIADRETYWEGCSDDVKSVYSKEYAINSIRAIAKVAKNVSSKSVNPVVEAIEDCLTSLNPECRQIVPSNNFIDPGYVVFSILRRLPERISDFVFLLISKQTEQMVLREFTTKKTL